MGQRCTGKTRWKSDHTENTRRSDANSLPSVASFPAAGFGGTVVGVPAVGQCVCVPRFVAAGDALVPERACNSEWLCV